MSRALVIVALAVFAGLAPKGAKAVPLLADTSKHLVAITTGFTGDEVLVFGTIDEPGDVVVVVRGPSIPIVMHRKSNIAGIWINTASMTFEQAPSFYAVASSKPLDEIARPNVLARHELGVENLKLEIPRARASPNVAQDWRAGLIRNQQRRGLYPTMVNEIGFLGERLFRTRIEFPDNVPTGTYQAEVYLIVDGHVVSAQKTPLIVSKVGAEAEVYDFAYQNSALYGVIAILIALVAGWLAHIAFRK
ncbi:MAG: TIGR02186 family protein [Pseudomonadota bacterium]